VPDPLDDLRAAIDAIDADLLDRLNQRARLVQDIGRRKSNAGAPSFAPAREREILTRLVRQNKGPLTTNHVQAVFREIISAARSLEATERVAYLGPPFTFSHEASQRHFGTSATHIPLRSFRDIFDRVNRGEETYGVVPVENTASGTIGETLDLFSEFDVHVTSEVVLPVYHNLLAKESTGEFHIIYSHPQVLSQCREWLARNHPDVPAIETASTGEAARRAAGETKAAAIGPASAAQAHGLTIVQRNIQDLAENRTRFYVIARQMARRSGNDKTAVMFEIQDRVGALHDVLGIVRAHGVNLGFIQSRPSRRKPGDYLFFVELRGHPDDPDIGAVLRVLPDHVVSSRVLGAWPASSNGGERS